MVSFNQLKKNRRLMESQPKTIRLALLADTASQLTAAAIEGYGVEAGIHFDLYEADYDQIDQEIFNPGSGLYGFKPDFVFLNFSTEHLLKKFYGTLREGRAGFASRQLEKLEALLQSFGSHCNGRIVVNNFPEINDAVFGHFAGKEKNSFLFQLRKINLGLMELAQASPALFLCDLQALQSSLGQGILFDPKMYINGDMVYSLEFLPHLAKAVTDIILSITGSFKKCVILDLDNTLWGGIIGDDGMEGIQVGSLGIGKAFSEFQAWLKELKGRGILLAVCSKNTESIAREPFEQHPDMVLRLADIAIFVANWENKVDNIRHIQSVLNIGFDSMVFLDDNPFEREMVKSGIPELTVPSLPEDPAEYLVYLRSLNLFETASFTEEDELRTRLYQEEAGRAQLQKSFESEEAFLENLQMVSEVKAVDSFSAPRVAQLTQRSNQFNLRTIRYTEQEILQILGDPQYFTLCFTLADKFGQHGLISALILKKTGNEELFIDTWIMSCRVLKRGMEQFTLHCLVDLAKRQGFRLLVGEYIPTKKNGLVKDHYRNLGFAPGEAGRWVLETGSFSAPRTYISPA